MSKTMRQSRNPGASFEYNDRQPLRVVYVTVELLLLLGSENEKKKLKSMYLNLPNIQPRCDHELSVKSIK